MIDWIIPEKINTPCMEVIENTPSALPLWTSHRYLTSHLPGHPGFKSSTSPWTCIIQLIVGLNLQTFCLINLFIHLTTTMTSTKCSPLSKLSSTCIPSPFRHPRTFFLPPSLNGRHLLCGGGMDLFWKDPL